MVSMTSESMKSYKYLLDTIYPMPTQLFSMLGYRMNNDHSVAVSTDVPINEVRSSELPTLLEMIAKEASILRQSTTP